MTSAPLCKICGSRHWGSAHVFADEPAPAKKQAPKHITAKPKPDATAPSRKTGRPRVEERGETLAATRPWEAAGMSRRTWFRRQAEEKKRGQ